MLKQSCAIAALAAVVVAGAQPAAAQTREKIRIVGSSTVYPFAASVVKHFGRESKYKTPVIESTGSGGGLKLFCAGIGAAHPDVTNSSRRIKAAEVKRCLDNGVKKITEVKIGADGIVLANSVEAKKMSLTTTQVWKALAKKVPRNGQLVENPHDTWSDIDSELPDHKIEVYGPPPTSGTRDSFNELLMMDGCGRLDYFKGMAEAKMEKHCLNFREDGAWTGAGENDSLIVRKLASTPKALGAFGYSFLAENRGKIQASSLNGYAPTPETISTGKYPVSRSMWFYVKNAHVGVIPGIKGYLAEFVAESTFGPNGYLADEGLIPLPESERETWRNRATNLEPLNPDDWLD